jgi:putative ABC transport system ATP-binding protein
MTKALLELRKASLKIKAVEKAILFSVSYSVHENDFIIILGSNGSGKSSLLKLIDKRYQTSQGEILLEGKSIKNYSSKILPEMIKTLTQNCPESLFESLSVLDNYLLVKQRHEPHLFRLQTTAERAYFSDYIKTFNPNLALKLDQVVDELSGGEKQALALALTVLYPPKILLLDEHTSALDPKSAAHIMALTNKIIQKYKITCLLTTHDLSEAKKYGNRILVLKEGKIHKMIDAEEKEKLSEAELLALCY